MFGGIRGQYIPPARFAPTPQVWTTPGKSKTYYRNDKGNPSAGVSDGTRNAFYNRADGRDYGIKGRNKAASAAARRSGHTRAVAVLLLIEKGLLSQGFVDGNA